MFAASHIGWLNATYLVIHAARAAALSKNPIPAYCNAEIN